MYIDEKRKLRKSMKQLRDSLPAEYRFHSSRECHRILKNSSLYHDNDWIYSYISFGSELETLTLIEDMIREGKHVACPKVTGNTMEFFEIRSLNDCEPGVWGIAEPSLKTSAYTSFTSFNSHNSYASSTDLARTSPVTLPGGLMILPGLAFDWSGNRLGYGGGYYDRYLASHSDHITVALAFSEQIIDTVPVKEHDYKAQYIITPDGLVVSL